MTQRTYKGKPAPDWAEYVVFGPLSGLMYWANDHRCLCPKTGMGNRNSDHLISCWRREELDPLPTAEVWFLASPHLADPCLLDTYDSEAEAAEAARVLSGDWPGVEFHTCRATRKITQPKPVLPDLVEEKL